MFIPAHDVELAVRRARSLNTPGKEGSVYVDVDEYALEGEARALGFQAVYDAVELKLIVVPDPPPPPVDFKSMFVPEGVIVTELSEDPNVSAPVSPAKEDTPEPPPPEGGTETGDKERALGFSTVQGG